MLKITKVGRAVSTSANVSANAGGGLYVRDAALNLPAKVLAGGMPAIEEYFGAAIEAIREYLGETSQAQYEEQVRAAADKAEQRKQKKAGK